jgi:hypothetical protein
MLTAPTTKTAIPVIETEFGYPDGYRYPDRVADQAATLRSHFPELHNSVGVFSGVLKTDVEGLFVIPRWSVFGPSYPFAVERVLEVLATQRRFFNCCDLQDLRETGAKSRTLHAIAEQQKFCDMLVLPAQFGFEWRGLSALDFVDAKGLGSHHFGLGIFESACMLLTHPERLTDNYQLGLDCPGDLYGPSGFTPFFRQNGGKLRLGAHPADVLRSDLGSVTGQQLSRQ